MSLRVGRFNESENENPFYPDSLIPDGINEAEWPNIPEGFTKFMIMKCWQEEMWGKYDGQSKVTLRLLTGDGLTVEKVFYLLYDNINLYWFLYCILGEEPHGQLSLSKLHGIVFEAVVSYRFTRKARIVLDFSNIKVL
ncbi:hypothetical protein [Sporolactobacillus laevolacticus]|uniref:Uncharacterized protein n=1 Tax=Sporolactobacillus laevolacticus DSM 442 TaxID=1395513 RepID=V6IXA0_9BACL|nr:hypothetical protein [Sporolactobacillus laevolacticus]EST12003.1 hypothetical protein P343_09930 [Sporolactobacillus laevolacticus DSM 442]